MKHHARPPTKPGPALASLLAVATVLWGCAAPARAADSPWLYGIHWYGDPNGIVESMTGGKGIWSLEIVETDSDVWWSAAWQRDYRFTTMVARGHTLIVRIERNWGETVPFPEHVAEYLADVQTAAADLANVCHIWQIGNEMNLYGEWGGNVLTAAQYADLYRQIRTAIKSVPSPLGEQLVLVGPVSPGDVISSVRHTEGLDYLGQLCDLLSPDEVDGFGIHGYAAPWYTVADSRADFQSCYLSQLAVLDSKGMRSKPVYITEWNRRVEPINEANEAASAQFLHGALSDLHAWNTRPGAHGIATACWFIYSYDAGTWANYSIEYLHTVGPTGPDNDLWDALQYACTLNLPAGQPQPQPVAMQAAVPPGGNVALAATGVWTDSGDGSLAIDGVISAASKWTSGNTPPPHWLQLDLGGTRLVTGFVVRHAGAAGEPAHFNTRAFFFETADSAAGPWTIVEPVFNQATANSTARTFLIAPRLLRHVRLLIADPGMDNRARIPEFEVYAESPVGDFDQNGVVNFADFQYFAFCMGGPDTTFAPGHVCLRGDADGDSDLDTADFAAFQQGCGP